MRKKLLSTLVLAAVVLQSGLCSALPAIDFDQGVDAGQALRSARSAGSGGVPVASPAAVAVPKDAKPAGAQAAKGAADWTILVFINGKNNLEPFASKNVNSMETVGSSDRLNIVVEMATLKGGSKRYLIAKDDKPDLVTSPVVQDLGSVDMGDYRHLAEFGAWGKANYPASHTMLIVWNHGSGWLKSAESEITRGISYDDETGHHITTEQLAQALARMGGVDVYASDACLMQMAEVAYQLKDLAPVIVGSEEVIPGDGFNYAGLLGRLAADPGAGAEEVGQAVVDSYKEFYAAAGRGTTMSVLRSKTLDGLAPLVDAWTSAVMRADEKAAVKEARDKVRSYSIRDNVDLVNFVELLGARTSDPSVRSTGQALTQFVKEKLVAANGTTNGSGSNGDYAASAGLAVYLPRTMFNKDYAELAWAKASDWSRFAQYVIDACKPPAAEMAGRQGVSPAAEPLQQG